MDHSEHTALVTGANSGLGFEAAAQLADAGYSRVILACRTAEKASAARTQLIERTGKQVFEVLVIDVAELKVSERAAQELIDQPHTIDLLVLLGQWGSPGSCDIDGSGTVSTADLLALLAGWGPCS